MTWVKRADTREDGGGRAEHPRGSKRRYDNLLAVSASLRGYGRVLKLGGWVIGIGGGLAGAAAGGAGENLSKLMSIPILVMACAAGLAVHAMGTTIAAMGEGLLALSDIALNTWSGGAKNGKRRGRDEDEADEADVA
jgi:hypothetical protein